MRIRSISLLIALLCVGLFAEEVAALPTALPGGPETLDQSRPETLVARKRRPTRRRRKVKPKPPEPAPAPAPDPEPAPGAAAADGGGSTLPMGPGGRTRVDFDAQMIKGQTTKAGEVQILERKDSELKSMVKRRTSFREEIILSVFPEKAGSL